MDALQAVLLQPPLEALVGWPARPFHHPQGLPLAILVLWFDAEQRGIYILLAIEQQQLFWLLLELLLFALIQLLQLVLRGSVSHQSFLLSSSALLLQALS